MQQLRLEASLVPREPSVSLVKQAHDILNDIVIFIVIVISTAIDLTLILFFFTPIVLLLG